MTTDYRERFVQGLVIAGLLYALCARGQDLMRWNEVQAARRSTAVGWRPPGSPLVWYPMNAASPTADASGNGHTMVLGGGAAQPTYVSDDDGYSFDGGDWAEIGTSTSLLNGTNKVSVAYWVKNAAAGAGETPLSTTGTSGCRFYWSSGGNEYCYLNGNFSVFPITTRTVWHHIVETYDGANRYAYLDGTQVDKDAQTGNLAIAVKWLIGSYDKATVFLNGNIDDVVLWPSVLTSNQVHTLWLDTKDVH